jgi:hypothetical protein
MSPSFTKRKIDGYVSGDPKRMRGRRGTTRSQPLHEAYPEWK